MSTPERHIIAMGGGGFSMEPENPVLDLYVLRHARSKNPRVCFLATASGDADSYIVNFYSAFTRLNCRPTHLSLFGRVPDVRKLLLGQDIIYVGGGNTRSLLALWRAWELPEILRTAWEAGVVLAGLSAGAICWFEAGITDAVAGRLSVLPGLGFLAGSCCPHYDGEPERRPAYYNFIASGEIAAGIAIDDGAAAHFIGAALARVVASQPDATAYQVSVSAGTAVETPLPAEALPQP